MDVMNTYNYIVPASGTTRGVVVRETLSATPITRDFREFQQDGIPFIPSGVYVDNTLGTADCVIVINNIGFRIVVPAGGSLTYQYPAPSNQSVNIVGEGLVTIVFVDYPVIPYAPGGADNAVTIADGDNAALGNTGDSVTLDPNSPATVIALLKGLLTYQEDIDQRLQDIIYLERQLDSDGNPLPNSFETLPQTLAYTGDNMTSITVTNGAESYVQTLGYDSNDKLISISGWVKQ